MEEAKNKNVCNSAYVTVMCKNSSMICSMLLVHGMEEDEEDKEDVAWGPQALLLNRREEGNVERSRAAQQKEDQEKEEEVAWGPIVC